MEVRPSECIVTNDLSFEDVTGVYIVTSRIAAILPFESRSFDFIVTRLMTILVISSTLLTITLQIAYNIETVRTGRAWKPDELYSTILCVGSYFRYYWVLSRREQFAELFSECRELWKFCDAKGRATVKKYERKIRLVYGICAVNCILLLILVPMNALSMRLPALEPNGTERRILAYHWLTDDEPQKYLGYPATFAIQVILTMIMTPCSLMCEAATAVSIMLSAGYFCQLGQRLTEISERATDPTDTDFDEFMNCVKFHQRLLAYNDKLKKFSQTLLLTQLLTYGYSISLVLLKLAGSDEDKNEHMPMMFICTCLLFMTQWTPDQLADQSEAVAEDIYNLLTRCLSDKRLCRNLHIMLVRAQIPVQFMAGGFVVLSIENFTSMMKGAYSFFTVLRSFDF